MFVWKDENKQKRGRGWPIFKKKLLIKMAKKIENNLVI